MSRHDDVMSENETFRRRFYVLQNDQVTPVGDLTGFAVTLTLAASSKSAALYTFAGIVVTAAAALCEIEVSTTEIGGITDGQYWGRAKVSNGSDSYMPFEGWITKGAA